MIPTPVDSPVYGAGCRTFLSSRLASIFLPHWWKQITFDGTRAYELYELDGLMRQGFSAPTTQRAMRQNISKAWESDSQRWKVFFTTPPCHRIFLCSLGTDNLLHAITNTYDWAALAFQNKLKLSCLRLANRRKSHKQAIAASYFFAFFNNANLPHSSSELKYKF